MTLQSLPQGEMADQRPAGGAAMQGGGRLHVGAQQLLDRLLLFALSQLTGDWSSASTACLPLLMLRFPCATPACCLPPQVTSQYAILQCTSMRLAKILVGDFTTCLPLLMLCLPFATPVCCLQPQVMHSECLRAHCACALALFAGILAVLEDLMV